MTAEDIQKLLYRHFHNYDYKLQNSYIYNVAGECDFFGVSKSGYQMEVEIKVSRSDFFVDFKKDKHRFYTAAFNKQSHLVVDMGRPTYPEPNSIYGKYDYYIPQYPNFRQGWYRNDEGRIQKQEHDQMLKNWPGLTLRKMRGDLYGEHHKIRIHVLDKMLMPHRFIYAVPKGLIKPNEVPAYAGLLETDGFAVEETKRAPYIHKRHQDISSILMKKFYYECLDWRSGRKRLKEADL